MLLLKMFVKCFPELLQQTHFSYVFCSREKNVSANEQSVLQFDVLEVTKTEVQRSGSESCGVLPVSSSQYLLNVVQTGKSGQWTLKAQWSSGCVVGQRCDTGQKSQESPTLNTESWRSDVFEVSFVILMNWLFNSLPSLTPPPLCYRLYAFLSSTCCFVSTVTASIRF